MKKIYVTHTYELTATIEVEVPDNYTSEELHKSLIEFPLNATIESMWDNEFEGTDFEVGNVSLDSLMCLDGTMLITDEEGARI